MSQTINNLLVWGINPNTNKIYPRLWCYAYLNKPNTNKIYQRLWCYSYLNNKLEHEQTDKKKIFKEVVKDFKMTDEDKKHLHRLLTSFDLDDYIEYGEYYSKEFRDFLKKYNFNYASD